ncbi:enoyl-CoA hydratase/isomerase family protein [Lysobacter sp. SG-8]|uniref:Enoyl-CoA hydratase/isomerase family protein n=1 Tax=Marilutibacter penaei TaxID=2759900 RepID=A0A7W3U5I9_9GAMM|nr:enoyl-CoA hydratase/isomerase family protein [Lysobacter penaei]MBB1089331.1 enoyl-CoA hydratase/isomerase family protein [Lysobacter penaei]
MSCVDILAHGDITELRLARAPVNALDPGLCRDLGSAIDAAIASGAHGLVLSGGPKVFSAGLDVPHLLSLGQDRSAVKAAWEDFFGAARRLAASPVPVVAAIGGHSPAGGCVLALCCDYRVMASGPFRIGLNETRVGLVVPEGIQRLMRRVVGPYRAERLMVAGEMVESAQALDFGLVDELVGVDEVSQRALAWLQDLLALPRTPMLQTRRIARADVLDAMEPGLIGLDRFLDGWFEDDTQRALHALVASLKK